MLLNVKCTLRGELKIFIKSFLFSSILSAQRLSALLSSVANLIFKWLASLHKMNFYMTYERLNLNLVFFKTF